MRGGKILAVGHTVCRDTAWAQVCKPIPWHERRGALPWCLGWALSHSLPSMMMCMSPETASHPAMNRSFLLSPTRPVSQRGAKPWVWGPLVMRRVNHGRQHQLLLLRQMAARPDQRDSECPPTQCQPEISQIAAYTATAAVPTVARM